MTNETNVKVYFSLLGIMLILMLILNQLAYEDLTEYQNNPKLQVAMEGNDVNESNR